MIPNSIMSKLTYEEAQELFTAGWLAGYVSPDVSHRSVLDVIERDFTEYCFRPDYPLALPWTSSRPVYDHMNPDVTHLFK